MTLTAVLMMSRYRKGVSVTTSVVSATLCQPTRLIDAEVDEMEGPLDSPDPLADGSVELGSATGASEGTTLQMVATSADVDLAQRSPLIRHEELSRLKLAMLEHKRDVLFGLRRSGTVDDLVVRRISANLDLEQVRVQGIEQLD